MKSVVILLGLLLVQRSSDVKSSSFDICEDYNNMSAECITKFYYDNDYKHLDTALIYIDEALLSCKQYKKLLSLRKLSILSIKQDFAPALTFIDSIDRDLFGELPYFHNLLRNRFVAMRYQSENKIQSRNSNLKLSIDEIEDFLSLNKFKVDSLVQLQEIDKILSNRLSTALTQYYYYKSIVEGKENITNEISNKQNEINGNSDFFDYLKDCLEEDFMIFIGI
jgi:hypothetical protein